MTAYIQLKQHIGNLCKPIVKENTHVMRGQLIATPEGMGANIHASVSGEVVKITASEVIIRMDENQSGDYVPIPETSSNLEAIKLAGVVGAGGAGFPTHIKYETKVKDGYVIANAVECEPLLGHNVKLMEEHPDMIIRGLKYLLEISHGKTAYIAIKSKYRKAVLALGKACKDEPNIELKFISDLYPAGDERVIIRELLGVELRPEQLPNYANAVVSNVETIKRVVEAIELRKPYIDTDITVAGRVVARKTFENQPIGVPISHYIEACGGYVKPYGEIIVGGPFTGASETSETPVTKTTGGILVAMPFPQEHRKIGLLACECGASEHRLREISSSMGSEVVLVEKCKRMIAHNGRDRCDLPGVCPGQADKILKMKKAGAQAILSGSCEP